MQILIITDAWTPQTNGVVRTLTTTIDNLKKRGHDVSTFTPLDCWRLPQWISRVLDSTIDFCFPPFLKAWKKVKQHDGAIHISTEGSIGLASLLACVLQRKSFTTTYHTKFPEYIKKRFWVPLWIGYGYERLFHGRASRTMVATKSLYDEMSEKGFRNLVLWERGVDTDLFNPERKRRCAYAPIALYFGRIAKEKNIEAFLDAYWFGEKIVIGDGPILQKLSKYYTNVKFLGTKSGTELAEYVAWADITVFPSLTDTYGLTIIESMACGTPVAAFDVIGPKDIIIQGKTGYMVEVGADIGEAMIQSMKLDRSECRRFAETKTWDICTDQFLTNLDEVKCITEHSSSPIST